MISPEGRPPFPVAAWMLVVALVVAITVGLVGGILSRSLIVDLVAMWPLFALVVVIGLIRWFRARKGGGRSRAVVPLSVFSALILAVAVHLGGWNQLPSSVAHLTGPAAEELSDPTRLTVQLNGDLRIGTARGSAAYQVRPILRGGPVGVPEARETSVDGDLTIILGSDETTPSWYTFSGWELALTPTVGWRLVLNGQIDADLSELTIEALAMGGSGTVTLGEPPGEGGSVAASGEFTIVVPATAAVAVQGPAVVPSEWISTESGDESTEVASGAPLWTIRVEGDVPVRIRER